MVGSCRTVLLVALAVVAASAAPAFNPFEETNDTCAPAYTRCVSSGSRCSGDLVRGTCADGNSSASCCKYPLLCFNGKCSATTTGGKCSADADCQGAYYGTGVSQCQNGTCAELYNVGDSCDNETQCLGSMTCKNSKCEGFALNETCIPSWRLSDDTVVGFTCAWGLYCNLASLTCETAVAKGQACNSSMGVSPCAAGLVCAAGTCVERWSLDMGASCDSTVSLGACKTSLHCGPRGVCEKATALVVKSCEDDSDCAAGTTGICECNKVSGKSQCVPDGSDNDCASVLKAAESCWKKSHCAPVASTSEKTCAMTKCLTATNKIFACKGQCSALKTFMRGCLASIVTDNCPAIPTYAKILIAFGVLVALIAIIAIVYVVVLQFQRKRAAQRGYTQIDR